MVLLRKSKFQLTFFHNCLITYLKLSLFFSDESEDKLSLDKGSPKEGEVLLNSTFNFLITLT